MLSCDFRRLTAAALVLSIVFITMPVSAADFSTRNSAIGSVSAVGLVDLRGVGISQEGTLFAGDSIRAYEKGYAKVLLGTGSKIELSEKTDITVNRDGQGVKIAMNTGTLGFTAKSALRIDVMPFEVTASDDASGHVAIMGPTTAGVRALSGKVTIRNLKTSESFVLMKGQEQLLGLPGGIHAPALATVAGNVPMPVPAPKPQTPAGKTGGGLAMDTGAWLAVIGAAAIAGIAIWAIVEAKSNNDDVSSLKNQITTLQTQQAAALKNVSNANAIANAVSQQQASLASAAALAAQAQLALTAAGLTAQANTAASISQQIAANQNALNLLASQIQALQAQLASGTGNASQLTALLQQEEALRATTNSLIAQLNALLAANANVTGVPKISLNPIPGPIIASASVPV
jgi:hypothetical protein